MESQLRNGETTTSSDPSESQCVGGIQTLDARTSTWRFRNEAVKELRKQVSITRFRPQQLTYQLLIIMCRAGAKEISHRQTDDFRIQK